MSCINEDNHKRNYFCIILFVLFSDSLCGRVWDTIACWPPTPSGSMVTIPCPNYLNGFNTKSKNLNMYSPWMV